MVGDVIITPFPYTDLSEAKVRPAIALSEIGMGDWVVCLITSTGQRRPGDIALRSSDMRLGTLRPGSFARPGRLVALNDGLFQRTAGRLTDAKLAEVLAAVRNLFERL